MTIETFGSIAKEENLSTVKDGILSNTLVLESAEPFPGYHGKNLPMDSSPNWLFFVTDRALSLEKVIRSTKEVKPLFPYDFDPSVAIICVNNHTYHSIRIRGLKSFNDIKELQSLYLDKEVSFVKKKNINNKGVIQVKKIFNVQKIEKDMYKDLDDRQMYYIKLPFQIKWNAFVKITNSVKNNLDNNNFDAALGAIYTDGVVDVVRVYCQEQDVSNLNNIQNKYLQEIKRVIN
jgi:hypothetical protein